MQINKTNLSDENLKAIHFMLSQSFHDPPKLEDMWQIMDNVWDDIGCDNKNFDWDKTAIFSARFYSLYLILTHETSPITNLFPFGKYLRKYVYIYYSSSNWV